MEEVFFAGVKIEQVELSTKVRIGLPVRYYDWSAIMAHFCLPPPCESCYPLTSSSRPNSCQAQLSCLWWRWNTVKLLMLILQRVRHHGARSL